MITAARVQRIYSNSMEPDVEWRLPAKLFMMLANYFNMEVRVSPYFFADGKYDDVDESAIMAVVNSDRTDEVPYEAEFFDCDDFSYSLMGALHKDARTARMPVFLTWVRLADGFYHAVVSYPIGDGVKIIEPQNDFIFDLPDCWKLNLLCG